jgi:NADH-quinone oxidoreductase subunit M
MILVWFIVLLLVGGLLAWLSSCRGANWPRWISLIVLAANTIVLIGMWPSLSGLPSLPEHGSWLYEFSQPWIPQLGIRFHLAMDGLSFLLILLVHFLGMIAVVASWSGIQDRVGFFHLNLLWVLAALVGVFLALDLVLFYGFWEMMLVPLTFLIGIWGHENRVYASLKFFLFTQFSGLLMLLSILGLYFVHGRTTGVYTFDYLELLGTSMAPSTAMWLMLGFFIAFAVKLSVVPVHTWLPDAHTEAPTAGSVILAGLVLKAGAYGLLRFTVPLFPGAALDFAPVAMVLGAVGILYGAVLAFAQTDLKRLVAYTSVSHMGFVLLGIFSWNQLALQGALMVILAHGVSTGALFVVVGSLQDRIHTRDLSRMGGLWTVVPRMGGVVLLFALASLGLPGLGNFVGEFLTLLGAYLVSVPLVVVATLGFILATVYALWMMQRIFAGPSKEAWKLCDLSAREMVLMLLMIAAIAWLGLYPQTVLDTAAGALETLQQQTGVSFQATGSIEDMNVVWQHMGDLCAVGIEPSDGGMP